MNRVLSKTLNTAFALLLASNVAFGLDSEYKNSLLKVELTKTGEENYNVNLYTQKKFQDPVKIIKKSDLNYYILLPETSNLSSQSSANYSDIRNVATQVFPYAGADINNGYTKIDISTTKPLNFNLVVQSQTAAPVKTTQNTPAKQTQTAPSQQTQTKAQPVKQPAKQETTQTVKKQQEVKKTEVQKPKETTQTKPTTEKKEQPKTTKKETTAPVKKETVKTQPAVIKAEKQKVEPKEKKEAEKPKEPIQQDIKEETKEENQQPTETKPEQTTEQDKPQPQIQEQEEDSGFAIGYDFLDESKTDFISKAKRKLIPYRDMIELRAQRYGLTFNDVFLMGVAGLFSFIVVLVILSRKPKQVKLKSKADLVNKTTKKPQNKKPQNAPKNNAQYFVFDNNTAQKLPKTARTQTPKRNFELSSYDPNSQTVKKAPVQKNNPVAQDSDNEIIHKILKEDSYAEIEPKPYKEPVEVELKEENEVLTLEDPKTPVVQSEEPVSKEEEPVVLSSVEIAPGRGFMCISYEDNIRLMGYIFDDVFALYNFKESQLEDYNIKFRLSEKTEKSANFMVKVNKTKLLISVTNSSMTLEIAM